MRRLFNLNRGSDYITTEELKLGAYREECNAKESRVEAATNAFKEMSKTYRQGGELDRTQACMRPCPPDGKKNLQRSTIISYVWNLSYFILLTSSFMDS